MGELYLDDIDKSLLEKYRLGLGVCWPKDAENAAGGHYSGDAVQIDELPFEISPDDECTCAS